MNKKIKLFLFFITIFSISMIIPNLSNAQTPVYDEESLNNAVSSADPGTTIILQNDITVTKPIVIAKELIIDGNGHNIVGSNDWAQTSGNQSMFTAQFSNAKLTLKNTNLKNGPKYGVQSYDGATVTLDKVSISGFKYGAVLANGGNVEVINLHLGYNGTGANNGIEIDKGAAATNNPTLIMNGILTSDQTENIVRVAENGSLTTFTLTNNPNTTNKIFVSGKTLVLTDASNNVIFESVIPDRITSTVDAQKAIVTIIANNQTNKIVVDLGKTITTDLLKSHIQLETDFKIDGFYTNGEYTNEFDFNNPINADTTIYAKISKVEPTAEKTNKEEKDETPKTGIKSYLGIAISVILLSSIAIIITKKKENI